MAWLEEEGQRVMLASAPRFMTPRTFAVSLYIILFNDLLYLYPAQIQPVLQEATLAALNTGFRTL